MKFSLSSDLHFEMYGPNNYLKVKNQILNTNADVHILAGDIKTNLIKSKKFADDIHNSVWTPGNHEYYDGLFTPTEEYKLHDFDGLKVFAGPLWTDYNKENPLTEVLVFQGLSDSRYIKGYTIDLIKKINRHHREMIFDIQPDVVVTHHAPSFGSVADLYRHEYHINGGYCNDYDRYIESSRIKVWCHGHTHHKMDYMIGNTRILANPRGYPGENGTRWTPITFEV